MKYIKYNPVSLVFVIFVLLGVFISIANKVDRIIRHPYRQLATDATENYIPPNSKEQNIADDNNAGLNNRRVTDERLAENRKAIQKHIGENYLDAVLDEGGLVRWNSNSFPLKVYLDYKIPTSRTTLIKKAFSTWQSKTDNFIAFKYITNSGDADFVVNLPTQLKNRNCKDDGSGGAAYQYFTFKNKKIDKSHIDISLYDCKNQLFADDVFYKVVLHEIGHGLGLRGHSTNPNDLMYPAGNGDGTISEADMNTLRAIYSIVPDITDEPLTEKDKENLITSNDVWGDNANNFRMEQIKENLKINSADQSGHRALARGYAKNKEYSKAIQEYENALKYTDNDKDAYAIYIDVSFVYTEANQLDDAEKILEKAAYYYQDDYLANGYNNLACEYIKNQNYNKAKELLNTGLRYAQNEELKKIFYNNFCYIAAKTNDINLYNQYKKYLPNE